MHHIEQIKTKQLIYFRDQNTKSISKRVKHLKLLKAEIQANENERS